MSEGPSGSRTLNIRGHPPPNQGLLKHFLCSLEWAPASEESGPTAGRASESQVRGRRGLGPTKPHSCAICTISSQPH